MLKAGLRKHLILVGKYYFKRSFKNLKLLLCYTVCYNLNVNEKDVRMNCKFLLVPDKDNDLEFLKTERNGFLKVDLKIKYLEGWWLFIHFLFVEGSYKNNINNHNDEMFNASHSGRNFIWQLDIFIWWENRGWENPSVLPRVKQLVSIWGRIWKTIFLTPSLLFYWLCYLSGIKWKNICKTLKHYANARYYYQGWKRTVITQGRWVDDNLK